jgi:hypothetical protein
MERERRRTMRFALEAADSEIEIAGRRLALAELGGGGLVLRLDAGEPLCPAGRGELAARLRLAGQAPFGLRLRPLRSRQSGDALLVSSSFAGLDRDAQQRLSRYLLNLLIHRSMSRPRGPAGPELGRFQRRGVFQSLLYHGLGRRQLMRVERNGRRLGLSLRVRGTTVEAARQLLVADVIGATGDALAPGDELELVLAGPNSVVRFSSGIWRLAPGRIWLTLPPAVRAGGFRDSLRVELSPGLGVMLALVHPRQRGIRLTRPVLDVAARGLSFALDPARDALFPGEPLERLIVDTPHGPVRARGILRSAARRPGRSTLRAGIELTGFAGKQHAERYRRFVFEMAHPRVRLVGPGEVELAWRALEASGYVDLLDEQQHAALHDRFARAWRGCAGQPQQGRFFLVMRGERPVATAAANPLYPRTWLPHHFGVDRTLRRQDRRLLFDFARETYSGIMHLLRQLTPATYFVFYFDAAKGWHELAFRRFLDAYRQPADYLWDRFVLYRGDPRSPAAESLAAGLTVAPADEAQCHRLGCRLLRAQSPIEVDAYSYRPDEIDLRAFSSACRARGFERERRILVARRRGRELAALVAECGDDGLNLFNLFNCCRLFALEPAGRDPAVRRGLLAAARRFYRRRGKAGFLYMAPAADEEPAAVAGLGLEREAAGQRWLARRGLIPAYLHYVRESMGMVTVADG